MRKLLAAAAALLLVATPLTATAGLQDFEVVNETGMHITELYVSESKDDEWGDDLLGVDVLEDEASTEINFSGYGGRACKFDMRIVDGKGKPWTVSGVDLCKVHTVTFRMRGGKLTYVAEQ